MFCETHLRNNCRVKLIFKVWWVVTVVLVLNYSTGPAASTASQPPLSCPVLTFTNPSKTAINTGVSGLKYLDSDSGRFWIRDKYEGVSMNPESVHKYLYVCDSPINRFDPSGFSDTSGDFDFYSSDAFLGILVHQKIGRQFVSESVNRIYSEDGEEIWNSRISNKTIGRGIFNLEEPATDELALRPDLVDTDSGEVYEIKPANQLEEGRTQLANYIYQLDLIEPRGNWHPGTSFVPPTPINIIVFANTIDVDPPSGGVIIYRKRQNERQQGPAFNPYWITVDAALMAYACIEAQLAQAAQPGMALAP